MSLSARLILLFVLLASCLATGSTAVAVTWHNSGDTDFTAAAGPATMSAGGVTLPCSGVDLKGHFGLGFRGIVWDAGNVTFTYTGCTLAGSPLSFHCNGTVTFSGTVFPPGIVGGIDATCDALSFGTALCHLGGWLAVNYTLPIAPFPGGLMIVAGGLQLSNGPVGTCPFGSGTMTSTAVNSTITSATGGPSSPHLGPVIARTP